MDLLAQDLAIDELSTAGLDFMDLGMTKHSKPSVDKEKPAADPTTTTCLTKGKIAGRTSPQECTKGLNLPPRDQFICAWDNETVAEQMDLTVDRKGCDDETDQQMATFSKYNTSWGVQYHALVLKK
jgi:hypothetical protein